MEYQYDYLLLQITNNMFLQIFINLAIYVCTAESYKVAIDCLKF